MDVKKNHLLVGKERVYDQELIYARVIGLFACSREMNFSNVLAFELAAYPLSMFNADGKIDVAQFKSTPKYKLQATVSEHNCPISATMMMMSALLWVITCPSGKLRAYVDTSPLRRSSTKLYDAQMSSSCLVGTSPTVLIPSRRRRHQDQVASIN